MGVLDYGITDNGSINHTSDIFAGMHDPIQDLCVVASGQGVLTRGTCLAKVTATGKFVKWDKTADDGSENLVGILGADINATDSDCKIFMYVHGEFLKNKLVAAQEVATGTYNGGSIVIREEH